MFAFNFNCSQGVWRQVCLSHFASYLQSCILQIHKHPYVHSFRHMHVRVWSANCRAGAVATTICICVQWATDLSQYILHCAWQTNVVLSVSVSYPCGLHLYLYLRQVLTCGPLGCPPIIMTFSDGVLAQVSVTEQTILSNGRENIPQWLMLTNKYFSKMICILRFGKKGEKLTVKE